MAAEPGLWLDHLAVSRGAQPLVAVDARIAPGQVLTLMGPSGSGKSTLLAAIVGALPPGFRITGRVVLNGSDVTAVATPKRRIGMLFQDDLLFAHLSVGGNLAFALPAQLQPAAARRQAVDQALDQAGLPGFADRDPATLSGGQRARVALMRTLLADPRALLLDEPFSRLDAALRGQVRRFVFALAQERALPVLLVTHDQGDADAADGAVLRLGPG